MSLEPSKRGRWRWLKIGLVGTVALLVVGSLYQQVGEAIDRRCHPPQGVLVDAGGFQLHLKPGHRLADRQRAMMPVCSVAALTGILRTTRFWHWTTRNMSEEARIAYTVTRNKTAFCSAMRTTAVALDENLRQGGSPRSLRDVPLTVLAHGRARATTPAEVEWEATWHELQKELAALSPQGEYRQVGDAGHNIPIDNPGAVVDAVLEMVRKTRM